MREARKRINSSWEPSQLFLSITKLYKPVHSCTIARWVKTTLTRAGIDMGFTSHSTRSAAVSKAMESGATLSEVLNQADWSSASTFCKYYYRPSSVRHLTFSNAVLASTSYTILNFILLFYLSNVAFYGIWVIRKVISIISLLLSAV